MEHRDSSYFSRKEEVFSKKIKAGKRTYFFDVKETKGQDYYIVITESKKMLDEGQYVKHKIFVYKEDFVKFVQTLQDTVDHIRQNLLPDYDFENPEHTRDYNERD